MASQTTSAPAPAPAKLAAAQAASHEDPTKPRDWMSVMGGQATSKYADPCAHAAEASLKCLERNAYDRSKCQAAFDNYKECKKAWMAQRRSDRMAGRTS